jgi:hypothetical protein
VTRGQVKRRLSFNWWQYLALALLPLFVINLVFGQAEPCCRCWPCRSSSPAWPRCSSACGISMAMHALIATQKPSTPLKNRRPGSPWRPSPYGVAGGCRAGVDRCAGGVRRSGSRAAVLLALSTLVLFYLYRIPRQLG